MTDAHIGDDGVVFMAFACSPLKRMHQWFGLDGACLFMMDEPEAAGICSELYWSKVLPLIHEMAAEPRLPAANLLDNIDAPFYSPALCQRYWTPYVRQAVDIFEQHGKRLFVHACGKLRPLMNVFRESGVHGLEGMAHPPIGDFTPADAWAMPEYFIYNAGFSASEQVIKSDDEVRDFYRQFFAELNGLPRFIFGAACQTTVHTPWERIVMAVEQCRQYGLR
jgi:uroporphyrinogen-III decarboxylase